MRGLVDNMIGDLVTERVRGEVSAEGARLRADIDRARLAAKGEVEKVAAEVAQTGAKVAEVKAFIDGELTTGRRDVDRIRQALIDERARYEGRLEALSEQLAAAEAAWKQSDGVLRDALNLGESRLGDVIRTVTNVYNNVAELKADTARRGATEPADEVVLDPLGFHAREAARALAVGVAVTYASDVAGDVAEFGTMTGHTSTALARAIAQCEARLGHVMSVYKLPPRRLHLFDSFKGLPEITEAADARSPHVEKGVWVPGACAGLSEAELRARVTKELADDRVATYAGWFKDTIRAVPADARLAVVHVDGDLYSSAMDVLVGLFERRLLAAGGIVLFDDWDCNRASPEHGERRAWAEVVERFGVTCSDRGGYGLFGRSFFVHGYRGL